MPGLQDLLEQALAGTPPVTQGDSAFRLPRPAVAPTPNIADFPAMGTPSNAGNPALSGSASPFNPGQVKQAQAQKNQMFPAMPGAGGGTGITTFGAGSSWGDPGTLAAFFQSKGVTPFPTSIESWSRYWNEWGKNDPEYFWRRLQGAEEFGGGGGGGNGEFTDRWGGDLERLTQQLIEALGLGGAAAQERGKTLAGIFNTRAGELEGPAYSTGEEAILRAKAFDSLERRRQETLKNGRERVYMRGFEPTSGLVAGAERDINRGFEQQRTGIESTLLENAIAETKSRHDQAVQLKALAQQALGGGDATNLQYLAQGLEATNKPLGLMNTRFLQALQAAQSGGDPNALISAILSIFGAGQNQSLLQQNQQANNLGGLGTLLGLF